MENIEVILNRLNSENPVLCRKVKNLRALHECVMALPRETAIKVAELALTGLINEGEARILEKPWNT